MNKTDQSVQKPWFSLWIILFAPMMTVLDVFVVNVGLPVIQSYFHAPNASLQLVVAAYLVGYSVFLVTGSRLGDHFGRKRLFCIGLGLFTLTSVACGLATSADQLILFRFLQGVSAALGVPQTFTLIQLYFPDPKDKNKAFGYYGISLGLSTVAGQFLGGYLIHFSWRLIFLINLPIGLMATALAIWKLRESKQKKARRFDFTGVGLLTAVLTCLIYPLIQGREMGWPAWSLAMLGASLILGIWFVLDQRRKSADGGDPIVHLELFQYRSFSRGIIALFFFFGIHNSFLLLSAVYFQKSLHFTPLASGLYFIPMGASFLLGSLWASRRIGKWGIRVIQLGCVFMILALAAQEFGTMQTWRIVMLFSVYGWGLSCVLPSLVNTTLSDVPAEFAGTASGVYSTLQQFSSALGVSVIGGIYFSLGGDYRVALLVMIAYGVAGLGILEWIRNSAKLPPKSS
jgi:EmrB/QacA subfamily drug resistance transporter